MIDCDNCERFDPDGRPSTPAGRRRAMTPNWDDPAVPAGTNPTLASDRYSLALIFLRVVGAANFPIQARQRQREPVTVDFAVPAGHFARGPARSRGSAVGPVRAGLERVGPAPPPARFGVGRGPRGGARRPGRGGGDARGVGGPGRRGPVRSGAGPRASASARRDVVIRPVLASTRQAPRWTLVPRRAWRPRGAGPPAALAAGRGSRGSAARPAGRRRVRPARCPGLAAGRPGASGPSAAWPGVGRPGAGRSVPPPVRPSPPKPGLSGPGRCVVGGLAPADAAGPVDVGPSGRGAPPAGGLRPGGPGRRPGRAVRGRHDRLARARDLMRLAASRPVA